MKSHLAVFVRFIALLFTSCHVNSSSFSFCLKECAPFIPGVVAYWPMNSESSGSDLSGNDNHATCVGLTYKDGPTNEYNGAAHFNGSRYAFASVTNSPSMDIGAYPGFSFSGFIRYSGRQDASSSLIDWSGDGKYGVFIVASSTQINLHMSPDHGNNKAIFTNLALIRDTWHFIGISYNKTTGISIAFKDGIQEVEQLDKNIAAGSSKTKLVGLGIDLTDPEDFIYKGDMSCMMLFKYALTEDDYKRVWKFCRTTNSTKTMLPKITMSDIGTTRATASWTKSPGIFSGYGITIERRQSVLGPEIVHPKFIPSAATTLQSELIDLVPGATYRVNVSHMQRDMIGRARSSEWFTTKSPLIVDVDSIVFSEITATSASVSWDEVSGKFDAYTVDISPTTEGAKADPSTVGRGTTTTSLQNLSPGISYIITIRTKNGSRTSSPSMRSFHTLDLAKPNTLSGLSIGLIILIMVIICIVAGISAYTVRYIMRKRHQKEEMKDREARALIDKRNEAQENLEMETAEVDQLGQQKSNLEADIEKLIQERKQQEEMNNAVLLRVERPKARLKRLSGLLKSKRVDKLESIIDGFELTLDQYREVMQKMNEEMTRGSTPKSHKNATVKMFPTYVRNIPDGTEEGNYLALDFSDTKFRVLLISLRQGHSPSRIAQEKYPILEEMKTWPGTQLFDHIAGCISNFLNDNKYNKMHLPLGFRFAFPCEQLDLAKGHLVRWTKGFSCKGVEKQDVVQLLNEAIDKQEDLPVECLALINDNVGTLMACAYDHKDCKIGLTVGEGTNACYIDEPEQMIINTEWGAFGDNGCLGFIRTTYDEVVDKVSRNKGLQVFEKMVSGMYMGEIVRRVLVRLAEEGHIFYGEVTKDLNTPDKFETENVSKIESEKNTKAEKGNIDPFKNARNILNKLGYDEVTDEDCQVVQKVCSLVSSRAAYLVAAGVAALLKRINNSHQTTVGYDGYLFKDHPRFTDLVKQKLKELVPELKWELKQSSDGSGTGTALVAAVAYRGKHQLQPSAGGPTSH